MYRASHVKFPESSWGRRNLPIECHGRSWGLRCFGWLLSVIFAGGAILMFGSAPHTNPASADWESALNDIPLRDNAYIRERVGDFRMVGFEGMPLQVFGIDWPHSTEMRDAADDSPTGSVGSRESVIVSLPYSETNDDHLRLISQHPRIRSLVLDATRLTDAGLKHLRGVVDLQMLSLAATDISDAGALALGDVRSLQYLDLRGTRVTNAGLASLADLRRLRSLNLSGTRVDGAGLVHLSALDHLETIYLNDAPVDDGDVPALRSITSLREIHLRGTCVSEAGIAELASLPTLVLCEYDGGRLSRRDLDALRKRLKMEE